MVRVNHPPGGHTKLHHEAQREPQTVRILKPPGGESSISFFDSDRSSNGSASPQQSSPVSPLQAKAEAEFETSQTEGSPLVNKNDSQESNEPPKQSESNGAAYEEPTTPSVSHSHECPLPEKSSVSDNEPNASTSNDNENQGRDDQSPSDKATFDTAEVETSVLTQVRTTSSESKESYEKTSQEVTSTSVSSSASLVVQQKGEITNGHNEEKLTLSPLAISSSEPLPVNSPPPTPTTPQSPSGKVETDTKDRVIGGAAGNVTPQQQQPRKIRDHMRSNIFMSDDDYTPTRSSRMNATVSDTKQNVQAAGQRHRVPPGGFSTKLW